MKSFLFSKLSRPVWQWFLLAVVVILCGTFIRFYNLTAIPSGLTWDEVAIGYSGWSVWETRRDEWLQLLPISFRSYGDYKAPFAIYVVGFFTQIFGLTAYAIRFPFALVGSITIALMGWLSYEWLRFFYTARNDLSKTMYYGYVVLAMALLAFSPWHIHFSRAGFESGMAMSMVVLGLASWYRMLNTKQIPWLFLTVLSFATSLYTYHSTKIVIPLLGLVLAIASWRFVLNKLKWFVGAGIFGVGLLTPLAYDSLFRDGATRLTQTSIFSLDSSWFEKVSLFVNQYVAHLTPSHLLFGDVVNYRQGMGDWGVLLPIPFLLILASVVLTLYLAYFKLFKKSKVSTETENTSNALLNLHVSSQNVFASLVTGWLFVLIALIPGALGLDEVPHTIRTLLALPGFILITVVTVKTLLEFVYASKTNQNILGSHNEKNVTLKAILGTGVLLHVLSIVAMLHTYFITFPYSSSELYISNYVQAMEIANEYATGTNRPEKNKIMVSANYGQPHMYTLFANQIHPFAYHNGALIKYEFTEVNVGDLMRENAVIIVTDNEEGFWPDRATEVLYDEYGNVEFMIFETEN